MSDQPGTLEKLAILLGSILARAGARLSDDELSDTLATLGIVFPPALLQLPAVTTARSALVTAAGELPNAIQQLIAAAGSGDVTAIVQQGEKLRTDALGLITAFATLPAAIDSGRAAFPQIADAAFHDFVDGFPRKLVDLLTADALDVVPGVGATLTLLGLIDRTRPYETSNPDLAHLERCTIRYDRITQLLDAPVDYLTALYDWGSPQFDGTALLPALYELLAHLDLPTAYHPPSESNRALLEAYVVDVTPTTSGSPPGLDFTIQAPFGDEIDQTLPLGTGGWTGRFTASGAFSTSVTLTLRPPLDISVGAAAALEAKAQAALVRDTGTPLILIGSAGGSRMEVKTISLGLGAAFSTGAGAGGSAPALTGAIKGGQVVIDGSQGDGFISLLLGGKKIQAAFDVAFTYSVATGLTFDGSSGLTIVLPASIDFGPFTLTNLSLLATLGDGLALEVSTAISAALGPVAVSLSRLGFVATLSFPSGGGNLGPAALELAFKPPNGLGVSVDIGAVTGGGFLDYDPASGRYAGAVALSVFGVQVCAIGLLDTKLPNGEHGYSFLILVTVQFSPIELGFGVTLNGVGGLCGINRDFVTDALQAALRAHNLDHVLFPADPIKNAPAILSDLATIFPPRSGHSVFAPMFKLGWGGDLQLVTAELGVVLAFPAPIVIAILGTMQVLLPRPEVKIVVLNLDVLGIIDPGQKRLSIDATLRDSRIASFTVSGDLAMRLNWGSGGGGALAIGGFNPHFQPPPEFPTLQRVSIAMSSSAAFRLTAQCYLAITSNTFQIGALCELYASSGSFNIYGWLGFDALFARHPFRFVADVTAGFALRKGTTTLMGIGFQGELSGTSPWHAKGEAHISLWFFDVGVSFEHVWGDDASDGDLPPIDAWPPLRDAISDPRNWSAALPASVPAAVAFVTPAAGPSGTPPILIEPSGVLTLRERVLPLNQTLARFGDAVPGPQNIFTLQSVALHGDGMPFTVVRDQFAPAQFEALSDQDKLSRPSFEDRDAGFSVGADEIAFGRQFGVDVEFNDIYVDDHGPRPALVKYQLALDAQLRWSGSSGAARSPLVTASAGRYTVLGAPPLVSLDPETFVVATVSDLQARADVTPPVTKGEAFLALAAHLALYPGDRDKLQVVPAHEVAS